MTRYPSAAAIIVCLLLAALGGQPVRAQTDPDPLFADDDVLSITLEGPLRSLARDRAEEPEERPGRLLYTGADGAQVVFDVTLKPRGNSRRDRQVCTFPPLWVNLEKGAVKGTLFAKQNKLKMVTYCRSPDRFQEYVIKEYLVYRILNELTDSSFRVRMLEVAFADTDTGRDPLVRRAFFIEHKKRLGKRIGMDVVEPPDRIPVSSLEPEQASIAELFQFMVSNTDFSFIAPPVDDTCCHNTVLFDAGEGLYLPVPYDFDRTGLVDPPNGEPAAELGQRSFRDRLYRGFCRPPAYLDAAVARTVTARPAIDALIADEPGLSDRTRRRVSDFIAGYYEIVQNPDRRARELNCRDVQ